VSEKVDVGGLDVLGDLRRRREEDGRPEVWDAGEDLLAFSIEWTQSVFLGSLWRGGDQ